MVPIKRGERTYCQAAPLNYSRNLQSCHMMSVDEISHLKPQFEFCNLGVKIPHTVTQHADTLKAHPSVKNQQFHQVKVAGFILLLRHSSFQLEVSRTLSQQQISLVLTFLQNVTFSDLMPSSGGRVRDHAE